jgi:hypothetical protein
MLGGIGTVTTQGKLESSSVQTRKLAINPVDDSHLTGVTQLASIALHGKSFVRESRHQQLTARPNPGPNLNLGQTCVTKLYHHPA